MESVEGMTTEYYYRCVNKMCEEYGKRMKGGDPGKEKSLSCWKCNKKLKWVSSIVYLKEKK